MTKSELVERHHLQRRAVIYIRQSTGHQVLSNLESRKMQHAMREQARRLGWSDEQIHIVEADTGNSAQCTTNRDGYKNLLSDIALGHVGIVFSYESARLSRNCSDWYPLMDLCAYQNCLIGDRDGVYDPSSANGRLLLGMKGILSEVELHTLRGRLIAGVQNKARRGELAMCLPAGLVHQEDGRVVKEPNIQVQEAIDMVFRIFLERKSASKVVRHFRDHGLLVPKRHHNRDTVWCPVTGARILAILRNPTYAGAFVYGRNRKVRKSGASQPQKKPRATEDWTVLLKDHHPGYITWETFEHIQQILSDNYAEYSRRKSRGSARTGVALLQGLVYCGRCGHKMNITYQHESRYGCTFYKQHHGDTVHCQTLPGTRIEEYVVDSFFDALSPAELDLFEQAMETRDDQWAEIQAAQKREMQRLLYEVDLARRQYDRVDPDNRLVASELERRWESALKAVSATEARFAQVRREREQDATSGLSDELRQALQSLGQSLPEVWPRLEQTRRKELLRCLIDKVVLRRKEQYEFIHVRIVWRGGAISERDIEVHVGSFEQLSSFKEMEARVLELEAAGKSDADIAETLTRQGFRSPRSDKLLISTIRVIRSKHGRLRRVIKHRPRRVAGFLTTPEVAERLGVQPHWLYRRIKRGRIDIRRDPDKNMYLFPDDAQVMEDLCALRDGTLTEVRIGGTSTT